MPYSAFAKAAAAGDVAKVTVGDGQMEVVRRSGETALVRLPGDALDAAYLDKLAGAGVEVDMTRPSSDLVGLLGGIASFALMAIFATVMALQLDLRGRLAWPAVATAVPNRFSDVAGLDEPKAEVAEIVSFLKNPESFARLGARPPRGVLMVGPPGTGKTLLARALAGEANVSFMAVSGSDFSAAFVGVSKGRVARLFREARKRAPCILFIDELDSIGKKRAAGASAADREYDTTLNQLLVEMDGFQGSDGVIVVGATNRVDVLDSALLRPGRFDRQVHVGLPDVNGRQAILAVHTGKTPLADDVDLRIIARGTPGFSGAELSNLVNEAAVLAARAGAARVTAAHFDGARKKMMMGVERRSLALDDDERRLIAVHEAGHALCATLLPAADRVHSATIVPHGGALGMVMRLPEKDRLCVPLDKLKTDLVVAMGGRAAEETVFGPEKITTGASSDISFATDLATRMVTEWGMSSLGQVKVTLRDGELPPAVRDEVRAMVEQAYRAARLIMDDRRDALDRLAEALLAHETLNATEVTDIIAGRTDAEALARHAA
ncbi:cell division protein FtsH [Alsobacter soli]|uniref:ATP-dependent zinc metalloprotease FtsH n=1 Tax=Alsobacter soli TaxID=2109933 RepID=A0A2T1HSC0_9HYPH|nr:AAA family ATPase [Alsobacter soli]PSC04560.1 cell division protein FtsH [Alsobacter soli]